MGGTGAMSCDFPPSPLVLASGSSVHWDRSPPRTPCESGRPAPLQSSLAVGRCLMTLTRSHTTARSEQTRSAGLVMKSVLFPEAVLSMSFFSVRTPEFSLWKQTPRPGEGMLSVGTVPSQLPVLLDSVQFPEHLAHEIRFLGCFNQLLILIGMVPGFLGLCCHVNVHS